jgi:predicted glycoside hydrolase/deacetylase ChbG (UPF0249 family)
MKTGNTLLLLLLLTGPLWAQKPPSLAEQLGYPPDAKLLILHADDLAVAHAANDASFQALTNRWISSASVMVPCPWLPEVAEFASKHPAIDLGLHLTLTSEWNPYKWGPVAPRTMVGTLTDSLGYFFPTCEALAQRGNPDEVRQELHAQVKRAMDMGIQPTHLDTHMGCLIFQRSSYFQAYLETGRKFNIPVMLSEQMLALPDSFTKHILPGEVCINQIYMAEPDDYRHGLPQYYLNLFDHLEPGVHVLLIHPAFHTDEIITMTGDYGLFPDYCAPWRREDANFFSSTSCQDALRKNNIQLITWRQIKARRYP